MNRQLSMSCALALMVSLSVTALTAQAERAEGPAPRVDEAAARAELRRAKLLVSQVKGLRGEARDAALDRAIAAYREISARHPEDRATCARAWYEVGELLRRKASLSAAEGAYQKAAALDARRFAARSLMQRAHIQRRLDRVDEALASYRELAAMEPRTGRGHTARRWIARCLEQQGDLTGAIEAYRSALEVTTRPRAVIELCNGLAKTLLSQGDIDAAADVLARAERVVPEGDSDEAVRIQKAVDTMSGRRALQRARDKANKAHEDARKLEAELRRQS